MNEKNDYAGHFLTSSFTALLPANSNNLCGKGNASSQIKARQH